MVAAEPAPLAGAAPPPPSHSALTPAEGRLIVFGVMIAMLIAALDQTIVSTALPTIGTELGDAQMLTWVVTAYLLASTVVTPLYGKLSDLYGRRITLLVAIGVFITGSAACALSSSMLILIMARTFQGLGGGGLISLAQTVIGDLIPPKERPRFQAYVSAVFVVASLAGPLLGGFIAQHLHWSFIFWINPPIGLAALALIYSLLRKLPVSHQHHQIDWIGAACLVAATVALMLAMSWGGVRYAWGSPPVLALLAAFVVFTALFFMQQRRAAEPLLPLAVLTNRVEFTGTLAVALGMGTSIGLMIFTPIYFESVRHLTPSMSGAALTPLMIGTAIGATIAGRSMASVAHYKLLPITGLAVAAAAMAVIAFDPKGLPLGAVIALAAMTSIGYGTLLPVATICIQNAAPPGQLGTATSVMVFVRQLGGAIAVALYGAILFGQLHQSGQLQGLAGIDFTKSDADFAAIFHWIFGVAAFGFVAALGAIAAMPELPLKDHVAGEEAVAG
jgi:EmrB/QacA subfamily drug resistance transporter